MVVKQKKNGSVIIYSMDARAFYRLCAPIYENVYLLYLEPVSRLLQSHLMDCLPIVINLQYKVLTL